MVFLRGSGGLDVDYRSSAVACALARRSNSPVGGLSPPYNWLWGRCRTLLGLVTFAGRLWLHPELDENRFSPGGRPQAWRADRAPHRAPAGREGMPGGIPRPIPGRHTTSHAGHHAASHPGHHTASHPGHHTASHHAAGRSHLPPPRSWFEPPRSPRENPGAADPAASALGSACSLHKRRRLDEHRIRDAEILERHVSSAAVPSPTGSLIALVRRELTKWSGRMGLPPDPCGSHCDNGSPSG